MILGIASVAALFEFGWQQAKAQIADALESLFRSRDDVVADIAATEQRLESLRAELERIDADAATLTEAAAIVETGG